jgi:signal transduction histidine kinase/ActR/RegA family two-component response regulator
MRRALPLSVQLLLTFVGLIIGMAAVLTAAAYSSSRVNLEDEARRSVDLATGTREQTVTQLFTLRQQRAEGFLASVRSLCAEPLASGRLAWVDDCVRTMVDDFRNSERALGAQLTYRTRRIRRSGRAVVAAAPPPGALATLVRRDNAGVEYVMRATLGEITFALQFDHEEMADLFRDQSGLGRGGAVFLVDYEGRFLTPVPVDSPAIPADQAAAFLEDCRQGADAFVDVDYRGIRTIQSFRPIRALGTACVVARIGYDEALAPAERLRADLLARGAWFVVIGAVLSLVAAQWISAPVRRLAVSARNLQTGRFDRPIPLAGPSEVRALGRAFNAMGNDLAELVAKEQAARRDAEAASHAKDEFLATVSHELRTPLTAILGWAQMLRSERLSPDRVRHGLEVIERSARAQRQLIEDLLDVSRIVSNRLRITREPLRLAEIVDAALDAVRPQAAAKQIQIEALLSEPAMVLGDPQRLEQVVWNLAWNAVKFTQPSGHIRIELKRVNQQLVLTVADTGVGIASAFLPYVFEWFRQADARSRSQSGLGLGLGIVRRLVQLHGGSVRAESRGEGKGATFTVTLPVHEPAVATVSVSRRAEPVSRLTARRLDAVRVLVVEDDDATRELVRMTLENAGASVEAVASASEARREMLAEATDVLISDIRMPEEDGYSLLRSLRGVGVRTPAIALTAYARREDADEARAAGFQIHLSKPIDAGRLIEAVATLVEDDIVH